MQRVVPACPWPFEGKRKNITGIVKGSIAILGERHPLICFLVNPVANSPANIYVIRFDQRNPESFRMLGNNRGTGQQKCCHSARGPVVCMVPDKGKSRFPFCCRFGGKIK